MYGVGVGNSYNSSNMEDILEAGNGVKPPTTCQGETIQNWITYLSEKGTLPIKGEWYIWNRKLHVI